MVLFERLLSWVEDAGATHLHVRVGDRPFCRVHRRLLESVESPVTSAQFERLLQKLLSKSQTDELADAGCIDLLHSARGRRYRISVYRFERGLGLTLHVMDRDLPTLESCGLPESFADYLELRSGLVLLTGSIGSGKSTTMHAMLNEMNRTRSLSVLAIEDPIEHLHEDQQGCISQCEVGVHVESMASGARLSCSLRPDLLFISDVRDAQTADAVLDAADAGMVVLAAIHADSVVQALVQLLSLVPESKREARRIMLANNLRACIRQNLVPMEGSTRLIPALEILISTGRVQSVIRGESYDEIPEILEVSKGLGMRSLDESLDELVSAGVVRAEEAHARAAEKARFAVKV